MEFSSDEWLRYHDRCVRAIEERDPDVIIDHFERGFEFRVCHDNHNMSPIQLLEKWITRISHKWPYPSFERLFQWKLRMARLDRSCIDNMLSACARAFRSRDMLRYYAAEFDQNVDEVLEKYELFYVNDITMDHLARIDTFDLMGYYPAFDRVFKLYTTCNKKDIWSPGLQLTNIFACDPYCIKPAQLMKLAQHMKRCHAKNLHTAMKKSLQGVAVQLKALRDAAETDAFIPDELVGHGHGDSILAESIVQCAARNKNADYWTIKRLMCYNSSHHYDDIARFVREATPKQARQLVLTRKLSESGDYIHTNDIMQMAVSVGGATADAAWCVVKRTPETEHMHRTIYGVSIEERQGQLACAELFAHLLWLL